MHTKDRCHRTRKDQRYIQLLLYPLIEVKRHNNNIENGRQTISYSFLIFKGKQTRKVTCFWGGQKCRNWTNTEEVENFCDDPEVGHLSRKYEDCDDYRYRWTELGLDLHSTEITNNRKFWLVYVYTRYQKL